MREALGRNPIVPVSFFLEKPAAAKEQQQRAAASGFASVCSTLQAHRNAVLRLPTSPFPVRRGARGSAL
ncbi:hypothetical protein NDU88_007806 [Pleurodeles waltl]|uniref:Uncharacterized protein n=1 Tax=Pleurodeles waltl TaxID=8319 RepID=A0AAV7VTM5_PLEWA|nr:hypothetical protein NDU88_007806 [Pleurodeles waltl]